MRVINPKVLYIFLPLFSTFVNVVGPSVLLNPYWKMNDPNPPGDKSVVPPTAHCAVHNKNVNVNFSTFIVSPR